MSNKATGGYSQHGANFVYAPSGLYYFLQHVQAGELYIDSESQLTATGFFDPTYDGDVRITSAPHVQVIPTVDPSGRYYVSASGVDSFTVTFTTIPFGAGHTDYPVKVADWLALL